MRYLLIACFLFILGCAAHTPPSLEPPQAPVETETLYTYIFGMTKPVAQRSLEYRDGTLLCRLRPKELEVGLDIINLSDAPFAIEWDQARFIDGNGTPHPVLHKLVLLSDISRRQTPTLILPQGVLNDAVAPKTHVFMDSIGAWHQRPLFPKTEEALQHRGATFGVVLPIKINNAVEIYTFEFQVQDVQSYTVTRR